MSCASTNLRVHFFHLYRSVCSRASDSFSSSSHTILTIRFTQVITTIEYMTFFVSLRRFSFNAHVTVSRKFLIFLIYLGTSWRKFTEWNCQCDSACGFSRKQEHTWRGKLTFVNNLASLKRRYVWCWAPFWSDNTKVWLHSIEDASYVVNENHAW